MKNQNEIIMYNGDNTMNDKVFELNYTDSNGKKKYSIKLFFTESLRKVIESVGYVLTTLASRNKYDLKNTSLFFANNSFHIVRVKETKGTNVFRVKHQHYVDIVNGSEYCSWDDCDYTIPYMSNEYGKCNEYGILDSPVNYLTSDEFVILNSRESSNEEKLAIIYSIITRANEKYFGLSKNKKIAN